MNIGICGYGAIGKQRLQALERLKQEGNPIDLIYIYDPCIKKPLNKEYALLCGTLEKLKQKTLGLVIIATPHDAAVALAEQILGWGCKVLIEKPFGRSYEEANYLYDLASINQLFIGFNYRFFDGIEQLLEDTNNGMFGRLISINMILGHGGSPGDDKTWKLNSNMGGGGVFADLGVHLLDLLTQIDNSVYPLSGKEWRGLWNTGIEEEVHLLLTNNSNTIINLQTSIVRWLNTFRIEVNGTEGYGVVEGRGKNYRNQTYIRGKKWGWLESGKSQKESEEFVLNTDCSDSFYKELDTILFGTKRYMSPCSDSEAMYVMKLYEECKKVIY